MEPLAGRPQSSSAAGAGGVLGPSMEGGARRSSSLHVVHTMAIAPERQWSAADALASRGKSITVSERDFRLYEGDWRKLRQCQIHRCPQTVVEPVLSPKSHFLRRCRLPAELRDPWRNFPNPEELREQNELDLVLNEVFIPPDKPKDEADELDQQPEEEVLTRRERIRTCCCARDTCASGGLRRQASNTDLPMRTTRRSSSLGQLKTSNAIDIASSCGSACCSSHASNHEQQRSARASDARKRTGCTFGERSSSCTLPPLPRSSVSHVGVRSLLGGA